MADDFLDGMHTFAEGRDPPSVSDAKTAAPGKLTALARVDRYVLLEKLGQGGFGAVYRTLDEETSTEEAVKALPPLVAHNVEELEKVRQNFTLAVGLAHPNIASVRHLHAVMEANPQAVKELGVGPGDYLIVMEYVKGTTLSQHAEQYPNRQVPLEEALNICTEIADALDFAHSRRIIHRDIKPANVMLTAENQVKILDFGLAAEIRSSMSRVSVEAADTSGTRPYMAPEQWSGKRQGAATDQYALAVLFYDLVGGLVPFSSVFETNDTMLMMNVVLNQEPEPLAELTKGQNRILMRALAKDSADRFDSCRDFISSLRSGKSRSVKLKPLLLAAALLLVGLAAAGGAFWQLRQGAATKIEARALAGRDAYDSSAADNRSLLDKYPVAAWGASKREAATADRQMRDLEFAGAANGYELAAKKLALAIPLAKTWEAAAEARSQYDRELAGADQELLKAHGGAAWERAQQLFRDGGERLQSATYDDAKKTFTLAVASLQEAIQRIPSGELIGQIQTARDTAESAQKGLDSALAALTEPDHDLLDSHGGKLWEAITADIAAGKANMTAIVDQPFDQQVQAYAAVQQRLQRTTAQIAEVLAAVRKGREQQLAESAKAACRQAFEGLASKESEVLARYGGKRWEDAKKLTEEGHAKLREKSYQLALATYTRASAELAAALANAKLGPRAASAQNAYQEAVAGFESAVSAEHRGNVIEQAQPAAVAAAAKLEAHAYAEAETGYRAALAKLNDGQKSLLEPLTKLARDAHARRDQEKAQRLTLIILSLDPENAEAKKIRSLMDVDMLLVKVVPLKSRAQVKSDAALKIAASDGFAELQKTIAARLSQANKQFAAKEYPEALAAYEAVTKESERLLLLDRERQGAVPLRREGEQARQRAQQQTADKDAKEVWDKAEKSWQDGLAAFGRMDFKDAANSWAQVPAAFARAGALAEDVQAVRRARQAFEAEVAQADAKQLQEFGGELWTRLAALRKTAAEQEASGKLREAGNSWQQARELLPEITSKAGGGYQKARYEEFCKRGGEALVARNWATAKKAFSDAMTVPGLEPFERAAQGLKTANLEEGLEMAEKAKAGGNWDRVQAAATQMLGVDPNSQRAKTLLEEAKPRLTIIAILGGVETPGARIHINRALQSQTTPATFLVEPGKSYTIEVAMPPQGEKHYRTFNTIYKVPGFGPRRLQVTVQDYVGPMPDREWEGPLANMEMVWIPPGESTLGSDERERKWAAGREGRSEKNASIDEGQGRRPFKLAQGFWMSRTEVTMGQWLPFAGTGYRTNAEERGQAYCYNPATGGWHTARGKSWRDPDFILPQKADSPVVCISWLDATKFCEWLTAEEARAGRLPPGHVYRLPLECEWEYACRGGRPASYFWWEDNDWKYAKMIINVASRDSFPNNKRWADYAMWADGYLYTSPVDAYGKGGRNGYGLADMLGNVEEWCLDNYNVRGTPTAYDPAPSVMRVLRGGSFASEAGSVRCAARQPESSSMAKASYGFRIVCAPEVRPGKG